MATSDGRSVLEGITAVWPGYLVVLPLKEEAITEGGLLKPEKFIRNLPMGRVVAQGSFPQDPVRFGDWEPGDLLGDIVVYPDFAGTAMNLRGTLYLILEYSDVWGVIDEDVIERS